MQGQFDSNNNLSEIWYQLAIWVATQQHENITNTCNVHNFSNCATHSHHHPQQHKEGVACMISVNPCFSAQAASPGLSQCDLCPVIHISRESDSNVKFPTHNGGTHTGCNLNTTPRHGCGVFSVTVNLQNSHTACKPSGISYEQGPEFVLTIWISLEILYICSLCWSGHVVK